MFWDKWFPKREALASPYGPVHAVENCTRFPICTVAKRLESGERDFLGPVAFILQRQLQTLVRRA